MTQIAIATLNSVKTLYNSKVLPLIIDKACRLDSISQQRARIVPKARGVVLEIGVGSGLNAKFYDSERVTHVIGVDPHMHPSAPKQFADVGIKFTPKKLSAETLPLDDNIVDSIVMTYTLCSIPNVKQALAEMQRVLKPNGKLYYSEHGLAPRPKIINKIQKTITPAWKPIAGGCHLDRNIEQLIAQAGFEVAGQQGFTNGTSIVGYHYWGEAVVGKTN